MRPGYLHLFACLQCWGEIYLNSEFSPCVKAFHFIFCIQGHSMDHSLTFLLVCKILYFNFCYYPNLSSLAFKGWVDKQSRVTVSRNFCYYHVLFKEAPVYLTSTVSENLFFVCTVYTGSKSGNMLWTLPDGGIPSTWFEEWCILFTKPCAIKGSHSILFTHMTYMSSIVLQPQGHFTHGWTVKCLKWFWEGPGAIRVIGFLTIVFEILQAALVSCASEECG